MGVGRVLSTANYQPFSCPTPPLVGRMRSASSADSASRVGDNFCRVTTFLSRPALGHHSDCLTQEYRPVPVEARRQTVQLDKVALFDVDLHDLEGAHSFDGSVQRASPTRPGSDLLQESALWSLGLEQVRDYSTRRDR